MKNPSLFLIIFLIVIVGICGCTQKESDTGTKMVFEIPSTPIPTVTTIPITSTRTQPIPRDPIIGHWYSFFYPSWGGKILNEITLMENQTWFGVKTEYQNTIEKTYFYGTWKKESTDRYSLTESTTHKPHICEYNASRDELLDTNNGFLYHRVV
jgi:hypothetical protein